jgi:hypothetical protein
VDLPLEKTNNQDMTEPADGGNPTLNNQQPGTGTDPIKTSSTTEANAVTPKDGEKAFDENVFDDPRLWQHPRFKSLNDRAKKADALEREQAQADEKRLADAKKFEELATKVSQERDAIKSKFSQSIQDNRIITEASKVGVVDIEAVLKLVDRSSIVVDDNGNITGATEAVQALLASKPFLKGKPATVTIGSATNPGADVENGPKKFKLSQLSNAQFYKDNEKDIMIAYNKGLIEDDTH